MAKIKITPQFLCDWYGKWEKKYDLLPDDYIKELRPHLSRTANFAAKHIDPQNEEEAREVFTNLIVFYIIVEMLNAKYGINLDE